MSAARFDIVIPTLRRPSLSRLLLALDLGRGPAPVRVVVVDDRPRGAPRGLPAFRGKLRERVTVLRSGGRGPAAARNLGWRTCRAPWIAFVDDDVLLPEDWLARLHADLSALDEKVAGSQGRIEVPRPGDRAPTDWERSVIGLESARWITADMAYRRAALEGLHGFDERFPRAYREDADLAIRALRAGYQLRRGRRRALHPIRPGHTLASVRSQAGNGDDVLLEALHGAEWRRAVAASGGRFPRHAATVFAALAALAGAALGSRTVAGLGAVGWAVGTTELALARIAPGPRTWREIALMATTSVLLPHAAVYQRLRGHARAARLARRGELSWPASRRGPARPPRLVLFDRDGTLIVDRPGLRDARQVEPMPGARNALARLREREILAVVVSNQPGLDRGTLTADEMRAIHARVEQLLGPLAGFFVCPHLEAARCGCRKPAPGLLLRAMRELGVTPLDCALIGDIGSDVAAAQAAGMRSVLVPTAATRPEEIAAAPVVAGNLDAAITRLLGGDA